jgi:hypothetical protein
VTDRPEREPAKAPLRERLRYRFDNLMSGGSAAILMALLLLTALSIAALAGLRAFISLWSPDETAPAFSDVIWRALTQVVDPGALEGDAESGLVYIIIGVASVAIGLIFFSALVAFVNNAFEQKVDELRKGKSDVIETDHTIVLGFGLQVVEVIEQLLIANESERSPAIAIVAREDKAEMDDFFLEHVPDRKNTRVITRSGDIANPQYLERMSVTRARSVIVLNGASVIDPPEERDRGDSRVLEAVMAVVAAAGSGRLPPVVAQLHSKRTRRLAQSLAPERVTVIDTNDILARILVNTSLNPGLAHTYSHLVGFKGHEIYIFRPDCGWLGHPYWKLQFHFINTILLGFRAPDGEITLNPPADFVPSDEHDGIVLAEDDASIRFYRRQVIVPKEQKFFTRKPQIVIERQLVVGWNSKIARIIHDYAQVMRDASVIDILVPEATVTMRRVVDRSRKDHPTIRVRLIEGDVHEPEFLLQLEPQSYDNVVLLAEESMSIEDVDLQTLSRLLEIRHALKEVERRTGAPAEPNLVSEVIDSDKAELFFRAGARDFLIPHKFVSEIIAQVSQEPDVKKIYDEIFDERGCELYVKPAELFFRKIPVTASFADCMRAAQMRGEVCLGVKLESGETKRDVNFGLRLPPDKNEVFRLGAGDRLVTLAPGRN